MKTLLFSGWSLLRVLRLAMGILAVVFVVRGHDALLGAAGGLLLFMAIFSVGCCGAGGCAINPPGDASTREPSQASYEEVR